MAPLRLLRLLLAVGIATLLEGPGIAAGGQVVRWHISNAWEDESCDSVCSSFSLKCTEWCWPATSQGLENAVSSQLPGTCFAVQTGEAQHWHPAKDATNMVCYSKPASAKYLRCSEVPETPASQKAQGKFIRRICPCIRSNSEAANDPPDCGVGAEPVAPTPTQFRSTIVVSEPTTTSAAPAPVPVTAPPSGSPSPISPLPAPAPSSLDSSLDESADSTRCDSLCVSGFYGMEDESLNGRYTPVGSIGMLSHWHHLSNPNVIMALTGGHWHFMQGTVPFSGIPIATARMETPDGEEVPIDDYYDTATGGASASFMCCEDAVDGSTTSGDASVESGVGWSKAIVATICAVGFALSALVACGLLYLKRSRSLPSDFRARRYETMPPPLEKDGEGFGTTVRLDVCDGATVPQPSLMGQVPSPSGGSSGVVGTLPRRGTSGGSLAFCEPTIPQRRSDGCHGSDRSASAVAAVLGRSTVPDVGPGGVYEGPLNRWWDAPKVGPGSVSGLEVGTRVRLRGFTHEPSWNGAEGEIDDISKNTGQLQIRLPDGRVKAARAENCELADRPRSRSSPSSAAGLRAAAAAAAPRGSGASPLRRGAPAVEAHPIDRWEAAAATAASATPPKSRAIGAASSVSHEAEDEPPPWMRITRGSSSGSMSNTWASPAMGPSGRAMSSTWAGPASSSSPSSRPVTGSHGSPLASAHGASGAHSAGAGANRRQLPPLGGSAPTPPALPRTLPGVSAGGSPSPAATTQRQGSWRDDGSGSAAASPQRRGGHVQGRGAWRSQAAGTGNL